MKRAIKFKAWFENEMHDVIKLTIDEGVVRIPLKRFPYSQDVIPDALMQFTGLKDKNGVEVYEGDVDKRTGYNIRWNQLHCCFGLFDKNGSFRKEILADEYDGKGNRLTQWQCLNIEVIGNIHEKKPN